MSSEKLNAGRRSLSGQCYVLTTTCRFRQRRFLDAASVSCVSDQFREIEAQGRALSLAWVVMPDHLHWLLELRSSTLADIARRLKSSSALAYNRMHGRRGAFWQAGYFDHAVRVDASLHRHAMYLMGNPVRAGLADVVGQYPFAWCVWPMD